MTVVSLATRTRGFAAFVIAALSTIGCDTSTVAPEKNASPPTHTQATESSHESNVENKAGHISQEQPQQRIQINQVGDLQHILIPREVEVEILGVRAPADINRIQARFMKAMEDHPIWFSYYVATEAREGKALPYHENFGVTKDEYERYGEFIKTAKFVPVKKAHLRFKAQSKAQTRIENIDGLTELDGIVIDLEKKQIVTKWGAVPLDTPVHASEKSWLGTWDGFGGSMQTGSLGTMSMSSVRVDIGRQRKTQLNVLNLTVNGVESAKKTNIETTIRFP